MTWTEVLAIINVVMLIGIPVGGYIAIRTSMASTGQAIQERVRNALHDENEVLQSRVKRLETENKRLNRLMLLLINTLKKTHRIDLEIDNDVITLRDSSGIHVARIDVTDNLGA